MKKDDESFSLFKQPIQSKKPAKAVPPTLSAAAPQIPLSNDEVQKIFEKMYKMRDELDAKLEEMIEKSGFSKSQIVDFFNDSRNWPPLEWERIQRKKEELEEKLLGKKKSELNVLKKQKTSQKLAKGRKGKTLGNRKKWLPIR